MIFFSPQKTNNNNTEPPFECAILDKTQNFGCFFSLEILLTLVIFCLEATEDRGLLLNFILNCQCLITFQTSFKFRMFGFCDLLIWLYLSSLDEQRK